MIGQHASLLNTSCMKYIRVKYAKEMLSRIQGDLHFVNYDKYDGSYKQEGLTTKYSQKILRKRHFVDFEYLHIMTRNRKAMSAMHAFWKIGTSANSLLAVKYTWQLTTSFLHEQGILCQVNKHQLVTVCLTQSLFNSIQSL